MTRRPTTPITETGVLYKEHKPSFFERLEEDVTTLLVAAIAVPLWFVDRFVQRVKKHF